MHVRGPLIIGISFASTAIAVGVSQYSFGLLIGPLEETFGWSRTMISVSLSFAAASGLIAPFLGRAMDRFGARPVLVVSLAVFGLSFLLRPLMTALWHWYALSFLQFAAFSGMTVLPAGRLVASWYPRIRGRITGVVTTGNNVGGLVLPPAVAALLATVAWQGTSLAIGLAALIVAGAALVVVRESPAAARASVGLSRTTDTAPSSPAVPGRIPSDVLRTASFYRVLAAVTLGSFTYSALLPHVFAHLVNAGTPRAPALTMLAGLAIAGVCGKLLFGWLSERFGARLITMVNLIGQAGTAALLALVDDPAALAVATASFGLFMGGFGAIYILLVQESFGLDRFGSIMGLVNLGTVIPFGLGPLLAGISFDLSGGYGPAFLIVAGLFVVAAGTLRGSAAERESR